jgi:hypothetical protein
MYNSFHINIKGENKLMKKVLHLFFMLLFFSLFTTYLNAQDIPSLAKELKLYGGTKATVQWERIFSSERHLLRYNLAFLDFQTRNALKKYLISHSADSQQPIVPGL